MKRFERYYYPITAILSCFMLILSILGESVTIGIVGFAFLISFKLEEIRDAIKSVTPQREQEPPKPYKSLFEFNNFKRSGLKETEEEKRLRILSENIENYDGSAKGQTKL
jgi:hypothetical protein